MSYDPACYDLAAHFISDHPELERLRDKLAQHIQDAIEEWIEGEQDRLNDEPKDVQGKR